MMPLLMSPLILLLLPVVSSSNNNNNNVIVSPGDALKGTRAVIPFAEYQTTEDRRAYLQAAQEQGYTCWIFPNAHTAAICIQVPPLNDIAVLSGSMRVLAACGKCLFIFVF